MDSPAQSTLIVARITHSLMHLLSLVSARIKPLRQLLALLAVLAAFPHGATAASTAFGTINSATTNVVDRFVAGTNFNGLAYAPEDHGYAATQFYSLRRDTNGTSYFATITAGTGTVTDRFDASTRTFDALAYAAPDLGFGPLLFYFLSHDAAGVSTFGTIAPGGVTGVTTDRFVVGTNFAALTFAAPDLGYGANLFYYVRHDATGLSTFGTINPTMPGTITDRFTVGSNVVALVFTELAAPGFGATNFYYLRQDASKVTAFGTIFITSPSTATVTDRFAVGTNVTELAFTATDTGFGANLFYYLRPGNDAPTDIALAGGRVQDAAAINTTVGTFTATDLDPGDTHTFTLVAGIGDTHNGRFTMVSNALRVATSPVLADSTYSIRVRATDAIGATYEEVFTVLVMAVLVDAGDYLIADRGPYRNTGVILVVAKVGATQRIISTQLRDPYDITVDAAGDFIVADYDYDPGFSGGRGSGLFKIHRQTGVHTRLVFGAPLVTPLGVKVEADGKLLVADADFGFGPAVTTAGAVFRIVPGVSTNTLSSLNNFYFLQGLALAPNGDIYVSDFGGSAQTFPNRVIKVDKSTGAQTVITTGGLTRPIGLAVESDGLSLVVVDAIAKKLIRVALPAGTQTQVSADAQFIQPTHVAIEADGSYIVTDGKASVTPGERRLYRVNRTTGVATILTSDGFFQQPRGVTLAQ